MPCKQNRLFYPLSNREQHTSTGRAHQDHPDALRRRRRTPILTRESLFQVSDALLKAGDGALEVIDRRIC